MHNVNIPNKLFDILTKYGFHDGLSDEVFLIRKYKLCFGRKLNLDFPQTFTEKLQWLKLYDRNPYYSNMVDKMQAKRIIAEKIGEKYVVPTLGIYENFDEIEFDKLPDKFVLKCTHDSASYCICKDKSTFNIEKARKKLTNSVKRNYYLSCREWPYKNVVPRIIAEKFLEDDQDDALTDYKFFCFSGKARIMYISKDASKQATTDFFDMNFNHLPIVMRDPNADISPSKPEKFHEMLSIAEKLSGEIPHLRVDFYIVNGQLYIGEMTFFHMAGFNKIKPSEWDLKLGEMLILPENRIDVEF